MTVDLTDGYAVRCWREGRSRQNECRSKTKTNPRNKCHFRDMFL
jgi:hypothetical protein